MQKGAGTSAGPVVVSGLAIGFSSREPTGLTSLRGPLRGPIDVLCAEGFRGQGNHSVCRLRGLKEVYAARDGAVFGRLNQASSGCCREPAEHGSVVDHYGGEDLIGEPRAQGYDQGFEVTAQRFLCRPALGGLHVLQAVVEEQDPHIVGGEKEAYRDAAMAHDDGEIPSLETIDQARNRTVGMQTPMGRDLLRPPEFGMPVLPPAERGESQAFPDEPIDLLVEQNLGENKLGLGGPEVPNGFVGEGQEILAGHLLLELLDALLDEGLIFLPDRLRWRRMGGAGFDQHGST